MSNTILRLSIYCTCLLLIITSCGGPQDFPPGISIYKTRGDYFDLADIGMKGDQITRTSAYLNQLYKFIITDNDTVYIYRAKLINEYVLDVEAIENRDVFLNLTFKQYIALERKFPHGIPSDTLQKYILDKDPYVEYYRDIAEPRRFDYHIEEIDTSEINQIIREGKIEDYFTRIK